MIFISSACSKQPHIGNAVRELVDQGFSNIELTGGTRYYSGFEKELLDLKKKYKLNYLVHNYFPPPEVPFILNLASHDPDIYKKSMAHLNRALKLTQHLGANRFGFHAGFFVDRPVTEIGKTFGKSMLYNKKKALARFTDSIDQLTRAFPSVRLYVENNCYSKSNYGVYGKNIPFMLLSLEDYINMKQRIDFQLLLDAAHLKISTRVLGKNFEKEFSQLFKLTDYIHISDNDGAHDRNLGLSNNGGLIDVLKKDKQIERNWAGKTVTLEIYQGFDAVKQSHTILSSFKGMMP